MMPSHSAEVMARFGRELAVGWVVVDLLVQLLMGGSRWRKGGSVVARGAFGGDGCSGC
uniref:Uncharacterized protein n=1 Tax=Fagus sylvatica TaxID=28930 RepID=A0A2N9H8K8_FAGSY